MVKSTHFSEMEALGMTSLIPIVSDIIIDAEIFLLLKNQRVKKRIKCFVYMKIAPCRAAVESVKCYQIIYDQNYLSRIG